MALDLFVHHFGATLVSEEPIDRRPLASRQLKIWQLTAHTLVQWGITPNAISVLSILFGVLAGLLFAATAHWLEYQRWFWLLAALCVQARLLCNMLDGMVAVESGQASPLGELYNEAPDRISDVATLVGLGYSLGGDPTWGYWAAIAALMTAYIRALGKGAGVPNDFTGPLSKPQRMFFCTVTGAALGLLPTTWRDGIEGAIGMGIPTAMLIFLTVGTALTAARRLWRIAGRLRGGAR